MAALIVACIAVVLLAAAARVIRSCLSQGARDTTAGAIIGAMAVYVIIGFAYALWTAEPQEDVMADCPGPPYTTC